MAKKIRKKKSSSKSKAKAQRSTSAEEKLKLRLYITGSTPQSTRALSNLKRICEDFLKGHYELQVIDVYQNPELAREQQIIAAPTLIKILPAPVRRLIGDMSDEAKVLFGLSVTAPQLPKTKSKRKAKDES